MTYSIIQVNLNNYDPVYENKDHSSVRNILLTDGNAAKNWDIVTVKNVDYSHVFDTVFSIRWNPFNYANTDYIIWVDGSFEISGSLSILIDRMNASSSDIGLVSHPERDNIFSEYAAWVIQRNYPRETSFKWLYHMESAGLNTKQSGLYTTGIIIFKNNNTVKDFCKCMLDELHYLDSEHAERLDQTIATFLLKTKFSNVKVLSINSSIYSSPYLQIHWAHPNR